MSKNLTRLLLLAIGFCLSGALALASDASGTWTFEVQSRKGRTINATLNLQTQGDQLTGTLQVPAGPAAVTEGTVKGDQVSFVVRRDTKRGALVSRYSGEIQGDTLTGTCTVTGPRGKTFTKPWTAKRARTS